MACDVVARYNPGFPVDNFERNDKIFSGRKIKPRGCDARLSEVFDLSPQRLAPTTKRPLRFSELRRGLLPGLLLSVNNISTR